jgi:hypothetical protein
MVHYIGETILPVLFLIYGSNVAVLPKLPVQRLIIATAKPTKAIDMTAISKDFAVAKITFAFMTQKFICVTDAHPLCILL